jgi:hypothetical protein
MLAIRAYECRLDRWSVTRTRRIPESMRRSQHRHVEPDVSQATQGVPAEPRRWSRLLDGAHPWGSFDAMVSRYGVRRYRLTIYPPGTSTIDRRLARLWRGWPITGAVLALLAVMLVGNEAASPNTVLAFAVTAYVSIGALLFLWAGPARVHVRSVSIALMPGAVDFRELRKYTEWRALVHMLTRADQMLTTGAISLVEHEAAWWAAYDRLEAIPHV